MIDPFNYEKVMRYLTWTFILIIFMIVPGLAVAGEQVLHSKIKTISPDKVDGQYCYVKIEIVQEGNTITKREVLECADGKRGIETPGYWELFAQFYYRDVSTPEYCRYYSRNKHAFKTPGKVCLMLNGEWEVR